jgi:copper chaperone NosL
MRHPMARFYEFLDRPIHGAGRVLLALAVIPLLLSFGEPLWRIRLEAAQYPRGLTMDIFSHKLEGGNHGQHIQEINTLNHYIGMHKIDRGELSDLDWIPFALGLLAILALRCAAIGNVRALVDLAVLTVYVIGFSMVRFVYKLYVFGHNLDPSAPLTVKPFTPAIFGSKQVANFTTHSYPMTGTFLVSGFIFVVLGLTVWHLVSGRVDAARRERTLALGAVASSGAA